MLKTLSIKKATFATGLALLTLATSACGGLQEKSQEIIDSLPTGTATTSAPSSTSSTSETSATPSATTAAPAPASTASALELATELNLDPTLRSGDYFQVIGTADIKPECSGISGFRYEEVSPTGQVGTACGLITASDFAKNLQADRQKISVDSAGITGNNEQLDWYTGETDKNGKAVTRKSWAYNRSHLIADSLGGDPELHNLITGTYTQNVGVSHGGMQYIEVKVYDYMKKQVDRKAPECPVTYQVTPLYLNSTDKLPRAVEVNALSCDLSINERLVTFNDMAGTTINYSTGEITSQAIPNPGKKK